MSFFPYELAAPVASERPQVEWEETACLLCRSRHWSTLVEAPDSAAGGSGLDRRSARGDSRNGVGRTWPIAVPATVFGGTQLGGAELVLATLHSLSPAPGFSPRGAFGRHSD